MSQVLERRESRNFGGPPNTKSESIPKQPPLSRTHVLQRPLLRDIITEASFALDQISRGEDSIDRVLHIASLAKILMRAAWVEIVDPSDDPTETATKALPFGRKTPP